MKKVILSVFIILVSFVLKAQQPTSVVTFSTTTAMSTYTGGYRVANVSDTSNGGVFMIIYAPSVTVDNSNYFTASGYPAGYVWARVSGGGSLQKTTAIGNTTTYNVKISKQIKNGDTLGIRGTKLIYFWGDSFTFGTGSSSNEFRFSSKTATALNRLEINKGIGGTTLVQVTPGDSSFVDRLPTVTNYDTTISYIFLEYGQNDINQNDTANFRATYIRVMDTLINSRGYPTSTIVLLGVGIRNYGNSSDTKPPIYSQIIQEVAAQFGVKYIPLIETEQTNGNTYILKDKLHPNNLGHTAIANAIVDSLYSGAAGTNLTVYGTGEFNNLTLRGNRNGSMDSNQVYWVAVDGSAQNAGEYRGSGSLFNTGLGYRALKGGADGGYNTAMGFNSAWQLNSANGNSAFGAFTLFRDTTGQYNTAVGDQALYGNYNGSRNTSLGAFAMQNGTNISGAEAMGYNAFRNATAGGIGIGQDVLYYNQGGSNIAIGDSVLKYNTSGYQNTIVGFKGLYLDSTSFRNVGVGLNVMSAAVGANNNVAVGISALNVAQSGAAYSVAIGNNALSNLTSGGNNTAVGGNAMLRDTTGHDNSVVGYQSLYNNYTGNYNTANGSISLYSNQTGANNTAIGYRSLYSQLVGNSTAVGYLSQQFNSGAANTSVGNQSMDSATSATYTTAVGYQSAHNLTTGTINTFYGQASGQNITTGNYNTLIGTSGASQTNTSNAVGLFDGQANVAFYGSGSAGTYAIGSRTTDASAILAMTSTTKGVLPPRMTTTQKNAISSPATGLLVYDSTLGAYCFYNGSSWVTIGTASSAITNIDSAMKTYTGTLTWDGTAPTTIANQTYRWTQVGKTVFVRINVTYTNAGATNTTVSLTFPSDLPLPEEPTGAATNDYIDAGTGFYGTSTTSASSNYKCYLVKTGASSYSFKVLGSSALAAKTVWVNFTYHTP